MADRSYIKGGPLQFNAYWSVQELRQGDTGPLVRDYQTLLRLQFPDIYEKHVKPAGGADGVFGSATAAATAAVQQYLDQYDTGVVTPAVWSFLAQRHKPAVPLDTKIVGRFTVRMVIEKQPSWNVPLADRTWVPLFLPYECDLLERLIMAAGGERSYGIWSWDRPTPYNKLVSSATKSQHRWSVGIDHFINGVTNDKLNQLAAALGFRVGKYDQRTATGQHADLGTPDKGLTAFPDRGYTKTRGT